MQESDIEKARREAEESPVAWFCVLHQARASGDFERAAQAVRELRRLGVDVKYHGQQRRKAAQHAD